MTATDAQVRLLMRERQKGRTQTQAAIAALQAANEEMNLGLSWTMLQRLSSRGGTSGIGIHSFFVGGFLVDGGQDARGATGEQRRRQGKRTVDK